MGVCIPNNKCLNANTAESLILDGVTADVTYVDVPEEWIDQVIAYLRYVEVIVVIECFINFFYRC